VWGAAFLLLIGSGFSYRSIAAKLHMISSTPVALPIPLSQFPKFIGTWEGKDIPLSPVIQRVAGNDDFVNRRYRNTAESAWANVYIAYTARPRTMRGHRPQACYPAAGWMLNHTETIQVTSSSGRDVACLMHQFSKSATVSNSVIVVNYYVVNGEITCDESVFSGVAWRSPNIKGNPARYVAQIQISSNLESYVRLAAKEMAELTLAYLPDENGIVKATQAL
jgi:hypothetical protein